jgi:PAS domain S-box-containing protein
VNERGKPDGPRLRQPGSAGAAVASARARAPEARPRSESLQSALYRIAEKANSAVDLQELFSAIHQILGELMYAKNCFIALADPAEKMIHFPYWIDEKDPAPTPTGHRSRKYGHGLTEYVLRTGQPLLLDAPALQKLLDDKEIELIGSFSNDWIGVPLKKGEEPFGILVLQSYDLAHRYGEPEKEILTFVSHEIARAIDSRQKRDELEESEKKFRALYRIAETAWTAQDLRQMYAAVHKIISELMYAENFYIALYDPATDLISFPYFIDKTDEPPAPRRPSRGVTEYVLRTGQPFLSRMESLEELVTRGEVKRIGNASFDWMGVPLKTTRTFGVMAVQTYDERIRYTDKDLEVLGFVAQQVARVIEYKQREQALQISEERYRTLFERNMAGVFRSTLEGKMLECNDAFAHMFGYEREELLALPAHVLYPGGQQERAARMATFLRRGAASNYEITYRRKDGRLVHAIQNVAIVKDEHGNDVTEGTVVDVTERLNLEEQLRQSQKMEAIGRLAGGVAHDFNNLLTVIKGYTELLLDSYGEADPRRGELEEVRKAADRAGALTRQLLAFSRQQVLAPRTLNLNQVVQSMDGLLRRLLGESIELSTLLGPEVGQVRADPGQLEQVLMNLAINARDAMPRGGKLTIGTANTEIDEMYAREHPTITPGSYVLLAVSDTGQGMDAETQAHIFEPFFTTKEQGKGTGLGLSTVYGIVKQSGGDIWVYSELGVGSTFKVYLPQVDAPAEAVSTHPGGRRTVGSETILVVEDEDGVRALVRKFLERSGYKVLEASNGDQALGIVQEHGHGIDLLLTDVVLPRMSGSELARRLADIAPRTRVLYMSGYTDDAIVHHGVLSAGAAFVQKPFTADVLGRKIREILDSQ